MILYMYIAPGAGADNPGGQNSANNRKNILFQSFLWNFIMIFQSVKE